MKAVEVLLDNGVPEERIIFINLVRDLEILQLYLLRVGSSVQISSPEGLKAFCAKYPSLRVV